MIPLQGAGVQSLIGELRSHILRGAAKGGKMIFKKQLNQVKYNWHSHAFFWASLIAQLVKNLLAIQEIPVRFLGWEDPLEKGKATHSSILGLPLWLSW